MRLFIAFDLTPEHRAQILDVREHVQDKAAKIRWVSSDQVHLTVKFLGEVEESKLGEIRQALSQIASQCSPFELSVGAYGCFPSRGAARVIWAEACAAEEVLSRAAELTEVQFEKIGFAREKRVFVPHITVARVKEDRSRGTLRESVLCVPHLSLVERVDSLCLFQSLLKKSGAEYSIIHRETLRGA